MPRRVEEAEPQLKGRPQELSGTCGDDFQHREYPKQQSGAGREVRQREGLLIEGKMPQEWFGTYAEDCQRINLRQFSERVESISSQLGLSDERTGKLVRLCLQGRAAQAVTDRVGSRALAWSQLRGILENHFYDWSTRAAAHARLQHLVRHGHESVAQWSARVRQCAEAAYRNRDAHLIEEHKVDAFIRGLGHQELEYVLRERFPESSETSLTEVVGVANRWLVIRESDTAVQAQFGQAVKTTRPGEGKVASAQASATAPPPKTTSGEPNKKKASRGRGGRGRGRGQSGRQEHTLEALQATITQLRKQLEERDCGAKKPVQAQGCSGRCWRCGAEGHWKAQCPKGKACKIVRQTTCRGSPNFPCACDCQRHDHFGGRPEVEDDGDTPDQ